MYAVLLSLCDLTIKDKILNHEKYHRVKQTRDKMCQLNILFSQFMYWNGSEELHTVNIRWWRYSTFWDVPRASSDPQEFHDQFTAVRHVCERLPLKIGHCEQATKVVLRRDGVTNLINERLNSLLRQLLRSTMQFYSCIWLTITDTEKSLKIWRMQCCARNTHMFLMPADGKTLWW